MNLFVYIIFLVDTYHRYYLLLIDTITNTFVIFIIDTNTNVSTILIFCHNIYCPMGSAHLCIYYIPECK